MATEFPLPSSLVSLEISAALNLSMQNKSEHVASVLRMAAEDALEASADIVFVCQGGEKVPAHAAIVALASSVVNKLVEEQGCHCRTFLKSWFASFRASQKAMEAMEACSCFREQRDLLILVPDVTEESLKALLKCIYFGSTETVSQSLANDVADAAQLFGVKRIEVVSPTPETAKDNASVFQDADSVPTQKATQKATSRKTKTIRSVEVPTASCTTSEPPLANGVCPAKGKRRFVLSSKESSKKAKLASDSSPSSEKAAPDEAGPVPLVIDRAECPTCRTDLTFLSRDDFISHLIVFHHGEALQCLPHGDCKQCAAYSGMEHSDQIALAMLTHVAVDHDKLRPMLTVDEGNYLAQFRQTRLPEDAALLRDSSLVRCHKSQTSSLKPALEMAAKLAAGLGQRLEALKAGQESAMACPACETSVGRKELAQHLTKHLFGKILYVYGLSGRVGPCSICGASTPSTTNLVLHYALEHRKVIDASGLDAELGQSVFIADVKI